MTGCLWTPVEEVTSKNAWIYKLPCCDFKDVPDSCIYFMSSSNTMLVREQGSNIWEAIRLKEEE